MSLLCQRSKSELPHGPWVIVSKLYIPIILLLDTLLIFENYGLYSLSDGDTLVVVNG